MNKEEEKRLTVLQQIENREITQRRGAELLHLSLLKMKVMCKEFREYRSESVVHGNLGRSLINTIAVELKEEIVRLYQSTYRGFNVSHFHEKLNEVHGISISRVSVYRILHKKEIHSPRKHRKIKRHYRRNPCLRSGELAQLDAIKHDWLGNVSYSHLHGAIDDATSTITELHFEKEETTKGYFELMMQMNSTAGLPLTLYTDRRGVFTCNRSIDDLSIEEQLCGVHPHETQFSRAMDQIGIYIILAHSRLSKRTYRTPMGYATRSSH